MEVFSRSFRELLKGANSSNIDKKGRSLEHVAIRLSWKLGLKKY
jgi:hypothetical protein